MKRHLILCLGLTAIIAVGAYAQKGQKPSAVITPSPLEVHGDSVKFRATVTVPAHKVMKQAGTYVIMPELGDYKFSQVKVPSSKLGNAAKDGIKYTFESSGWFDEDMIGNDLEIEHEYVLADGKKNTEFGDIDDSAECCITTGRLFVMNSQYTMMKYEYKPGDKEPLKVVAQFNFPQDISKMGNDVYKQEVKAIGEYLKKHSDAKITVRGYASPEGPYDRNIALSTERANQAKTWLIGQLQKAGYSKNFKADAITVETTTEDWEGFKENLANSNVPQETQQKVINAVSAGKSPAETEKEVIALMGGMAAAEPYLKSLRRSTVVVSSPAATRAGMTRAQIDSIVALYGKGEIPASAMVDIFNDEEYLQASQATKAEDGKMTLLMAYYKQNPGDFRAYSDLGVMSMVDVTKVDIVGGDDAIVGTGFNRDEWDIDNEVDIDEKKMKIKTKMKREDVNANKMKQKLKVDFKDGEALFLKAHSINSKDPVVLNNLGAYYLAQGQPAKALVHLQQSIKADNNPGVNYNMGLYYARIGNYKKALEHFNKSEKVRGMLYNRGLAKLMLRDYAGAKSDLTAFLATDPNHMLGNYVMAVLGARTNDVTLASTHIKRAIANSTNKNLSDAVKEDLEFTAMIENETFKKAADDDPKQ